MPSRVVKGGGTRAAMLEREKGAEIAGRVRPADAA
jgi:hypothetical protein